MTGTRRDWRAITRRWLEAGCPPLVKFGQSEGIPYETLKKQSMRHKWNLKAARLAQETESRLADQEADRIMEARERHRKLGITLQAHGVKGLSAARTLDPNESIRAVTAGVGIERDALGMSRNQAENLPDGATTQNFNTLIQVVKGGNGKEAAELRRAIEGLDAGRKPAN